MFCSSKLNKFNNLKHGFFSRKNGVSKGYYESLNCGLGSGDEKKNVLKNLELVSSKINCQKKYHSYTGLYIKIYRNHKRKNKFSRRYIK